MFHAAAVIRRNAAWKSDESLFAAGIRISKTNAKMFNNLGHSLETKGQLEKALVLYRKGNLGVEDGNWETRKLWFERVVTGGGRKGGR